MDFPYDQHDQRTDSYNDLLEDKLNNKNSYCGKINGPFFSNLFFIIQNGKYEIYLMWCIIITTIILLLSLCIDNANDDIETARFINSTRYNTPYP